ncbi:hypothetical protein KCU71_g48, partial [Aureobasidium melanogenum]
MSSAQQVLSLPEILCSILEYLEFDRVALYSAHLVNSTWARCARDILWRNAPLSSLAAIEPSRQQDFANLIRNSFAWNGRYPAELDHLSFPSLERCLFEVAQLFEVPDFHHFLPPSSKSLQYLDMWLNGVETVVDRRHRRLQGLWEDKLDHRLVSRRPLRQQDYSPLISGPKLRSLISGKIPGEKTAGQVLARLASHKIYEELFVWGMEIDLEAVTFMLSALVERPICPKLKHFGAYMWVDAARALFPYLPASLTSLFLGVGTLTEPWFHLVTQFRCLESLTIVGRDELLRMFPIYYLGRLGCLRNLAIALLPVSEPEEYIWFGAQATPFTDNDFEAMTSGLPLLQTFELKLPCELSLPALTSLATNCPLLEQCTLSTTISFTEWEEAGHPEFPNLSVLLLTRRALLVRPHQLSQWKMNPSLLKLALLSAIARIFLDFDCTLRTMGCLSLDNLELGKVHMGGLASFKLLLQTIVHLASSIARFITYQLCHCSLASPRSSLACANAAKDSQTLAPSPNSTAPVVVVRQQSPPVPGSVRMNRLPDDAIEQIFEYLVDCAHDVTNAMLISALWRTVGDKVLHMTYSTRAAIKSPRAHLYPLKKLVFSLDDQDFHESNTMQFEPEHVEVVLSNDLFVSRYISGNLHHLQVSLLMKLSAPSPTLTSFSLSLMTLPASRRLSSILASLTRFELSSPRGGIHVCTGLLRLLTKQLTLRTLRLHHIITRQDAQVMLQSAEWQGQTPFPGLETLTCYMELAAAEMLLPHLHALRHLDITLHDKHSPRLSLLTNVFACIAKPTELETLTVTLPNTTTFLPAHALMSLASLKSTKALRINSTGLLRCDLS